MAKSITPLLLTLSLVFSASAHGGDTDRFKRISPERAGYSAEKLKSLETFLEKSGPDSLLLVHDGKVFFEWGDIRKKILVHSMRKALLNSLYGVYRQRAAIDL